MRWMLRNVPIVLIVPAVLLGAASPPVRLPPELERARAERERALDCYRGKQWPCFLLHAREAHAADPASTRLLYMLAAAEARSGDAAGAAKHLDELLDRRVSWERGDDLAGIKDRPEMAPVLAKRTALETPVARAEFAFRLPEKDLVEGIAWDPRSRAFFFSSVHRRKILRRAPDGAVSDFVPQARDGLEGVLGIRVDARRGLLWAGSAAVPEMEGWSESSEGAASLWAFDLGTGRLVRRLRLEAPGKHALNDLAIAPDGAVWTTDSLTGGVYRWREGATALEEVVAPGVLRSAQGIGFSADGKVAYVSDWGDGIYLLDPAAGRLERLPAPAGVPLAGVDGLVVRGRELFVTQNGIFPKRVARLTLDPSGRRTVSAEVLEMNTARMTEPTLAVLVGDELYFVANSQWDAFDSVKKEFPPGKLQETSILRVHVGPAPR